MQQPQLSHYCAYISTLLWVCRYCSQICIPHLYSCVQFKATACNQHPPSVFSYSGVATALATTKANSRWNPATMPATVSVLSVCMVNWSRNRPQQPHHLATRTILKIGTHTYVISMREQTKCDVGECVSHRGKCTCRDQLAKNEGMQYAANATATLTKSGSVGWNIHFSALRTYKYA